MVLIDFIGVKYGVDGFLKYADCFAEYNTIFSVGLAITVFYIFANVHFYSKTVNWIAASVTAVYILHDNKLMEDVLWKVISPNAEHIESVYVHMPMKVTVIFICFLLIDKLSEPILKRINRKMDAMFIVPVLNSGKK